MMGAVENVIRRPALADAAAVHDDDLIAHRSDDTEIMGYHDDGHAELLLQLLHQIEDLCLNRHVERGRRLVGDQNIRLAGERHGDHDTLPHAA